MLNFLPKNMLGICFIYAYKKTTCTVAFKFLIEAKLSCAQSATRAWQEGGPRGPGFSPIEMLSRIA